MVSDTKRENAVEALQELGLKEYEAKCFVGLSRAPKATAKEISEVTDVPRTRIYDAVRILEAKGLVEVQHSSPQQFRAVPVQEAVDTLETQYETHIETVRDTLGDIEPVDDEDEVVQEVWSLSDESAIAKRTQSLIDDASSEVMLVVGDEAVFSTELVERLNAVSGEVDLIVGAGSEAIRDRVEDSVPDASVFLSGLEWLHSDEDEGKTAIGRLLLVDRSSILVSSIETGTEKERAIFGRGFGNGLVVVSRRLMATGLIRGRDPT